MGWVTICLSHSMEQSLSAFLCAFSTHWYTWTHVYSPALERKSRGGRSSQLRLTGGSKWMHADVGGYYIPWKEERYLIMASSCPFSPTALLLSVHRVSVLSLHRMPICLFCDKEPQESSWLKFTLKHVNATMSVVTHVWQSILSSKCTPIV